MKRTVYFNLTNEDVAEHINGMRGLPHKISLLNLLVDSIEDGDIEACVDANATDILTLAIRSIDDLSLQLAKRRARLRTAEQAVIAIDTVAATQIIGDKGKLEIYYWEEEKTWRCTHKTKSDDNEYLFDTFVDVTKWILNRYL